MILHVATWRDWNNHLDRDLYFPASFVSEGFIHCCTAAQLEGVLDRYFKNATDLLLLVLDEAKIECEIRYEAGPNGDRFPHVYGHINKSAIVRIENLDFGKNR